MTADPMLPDPLPVDPMPLFEAWFRDAAARRAQPNPDSMIVATAATSGEPSARVVLCKRIDVAGGYIVFFTNYQSRKGRELAARPRAAAVFHWDALHRQVRIEGPVVRSPESESDQYFASRALDSRVAAWASAQSEPLASRELLLQRVREFGARFGVAPGATNGAVPRPPHWGGTRLWVDTIELWSEGAYRVHDRAVWTRSLQRGDDYSFVGGPWRSTRLNP
ncbi:MAG TPA: pyridoxamine 5'-phosphate oxidase [Steroidobacteraceae bacterium]|nr:pyridoxamine 5'-phosphate oxidase [Steroidobacteraceae bacterium]